MVTPVRTRADFCAILRSLGIQGKHTTENSEKPLRNIPACKIFSYLVILESTLVNKGEALLHCFPVPASSATAWERMFMECDKQGHVLWMNERARARLGPVESLFEALPAPDLPDASQLLSAEGEGRQMTLVSSLQCAHRPLRLPVQLVGLLALPERVVLSAEVRARASDALPPQHEILRILLQLQSNATRNYFRLVRARETLANRGRRPKSASAASRRSAR